jgi:hypothetical protein
MNKMTETGRMSEDSAKDPHFSFQERKHQNYRNKSKVKIKIIEFT